MIDFTPYTESNITQELFNSLSFESQNALPCKKYPPREQWWLPKVISKKNSICNSNSNHSNSDFNLNKKRILRQLPKKTVDKIEKTNETTLIKTNKIKSSKPIKSTKSPPPTIKHKINTVSSSINDKKRIIQNTVPAHYPNVIICGDCNDSIPHIKTTDKKIVYFCECCLRTFHEECAKKSAFFLNNSESKPIGGKPKTVTIRKKLNRDDCLWETLLMNIFYFECETCSNDKQNCSICHDIGCITEDNNLSSVAQDEFNVHLVKCSFPQCTRFYHFDCIYPVFDVNIDNFENLYMCNSNGFICPSHFCHHCKKPSVPNGKTFKNINKKEKGKESQNALLASYYHLFQYTYYHTPLSTPTVTNNPILSCVLCYSSFHLSCLYDIVNNNICELSFEKIKNVLKSFIFLTYTKIVCNSCINTFKLPPDHPLIKLHIEDKDSVSYHSYDILKDLFEISTKIGLKNKKHRH